MKKITISVIIPCFNGRDHIKTCLNSIFASSFSNYEVIVVDDGSKEQLSNSQFSIFNFQKRVKLRIICNKRNLGAARSRNIGARIAKGKYLVFFDVDTRVAPDCLGKIVAKFEKTPLMGALQTKLDTGGHFLTFFGFPYEIPADEREKIIFGARTAGMAVRKNLFKKVGGFDEDYLIYGEDTDLSWRIWLAGYQIYYLPQAKVHHFQKSTFMEHNLFYEGAKNNLQNILKNAPIKILIWMIPLHIFAWLIITLKLLLQGRFSPAFWVYRGLFWNFVHLKAILRKRGQVKSITKHGIHPPLFGEIRFTQLLVKGLNWGKNV